jgi:predicted AlkP superfamily phosphohydrolase/phosphomutase
VWGPDVRRGETLATRPIEDVTPTVLHLLGLPVDADMDGRCSSTRSARSSWLPIRSS